MEEINAETLTTILASLGLSALEIDRVLQDPPALDRVLRAHVQVDVRGAYAGGGDPLDRIEHEMQLCMRRQAAELLRPLRKPRAVPRSQLVLAAGTLRATTYRNMASLGEDEECFHTSYTGLPKSHSVTPLGELDRISFCDMFVPKTHRGSYLLCRIISAPRSLVGVTVVVEDPQGRAEVLSLYNYPLHGVDTGPDLNAVFPIGTILAIREPTFKTSQTGDSCLVRVDSPSDLHVLSPNDPFISNVPWATHDPRVPRPRNFNHRAQGNELFRAKKFVLAVQAYTEGIESTPWLEDQLSLFLNRAQAHLHLQNFASAVRDASQVLDLLEDEVSAPPRSKEKALFRRGRAYTALQYYSLARQDFQSVVALDPSEKEAKFELAKISEYERRSSTGRYEWDKVARITGPAKLKRTDLLSGDFVGPIEVRQVEGRGGGRGVFATRDVKPGDLLLVEKSFATGRDGSVKSKNVMAFDVVTHTRLLDCDLNLIENVVAKLCDEPDSVADLASLYGGAKFPPSSTRPFDFVRPFDVEHLGTPDVDITRVEAICDHNSFRKGTERDDPWTASLFLRASMVNHSCVSNASWSVVGGVVIVRARTAIKAGEEILIDYGLSTTEDIESFFNKHFGSTSCRCKLCVARTEDGPARIDKRREILEQRLDPLASRFEAASADRRLRQHFLDALLRVLADLEKTCPGRHAANLRPELLTPLHLVGEVTGSNTTEVSRRRSITKSLGAIKVSDGLVEWDGHKVKVVHPPINGSVGPVDVLFGVARRFAVKRDPTENAVAIEWIQAAVEMETLASGGGYAAFRFKHDTTLEQLGLGELASVLRP
ncbi:hypothetical protein JCM10212_005299 [Sporobolomyces blumeae]